MSRSLSRSGNLRRASLSWGLATGLLFLLSLPMVTAVYGYIDDYIAWFWYAKEPFRPSDSSFFGHGRPLLGYLIEAAYAVCDDFPEFRWLRMLSVAGWGMFAAVSFHHLRGAHRTAGGHWAGVVAMVLTPATGVAIGWSVCFPYGWAAALALLSGTLVHRALGTGAGVARWVRVAGAAAGIVTTLTIYQPLAFFYFLPWLRTYRGDGEREPFDWRAWILAGALFVVMTGVYWASVRGLQAMAGPDLPGRHRTALAEPSFASLILLGRFLWVSLQSWGALMPAWAGGVLGAAVAFWALYGAVRGPGVAVALTTLLASLSVLVVTIEPEFWLRMLAVPYAVLALLATRGLEAAWLTLGAKCSKPSLAGRIGRAAPIVVGAILAACFTTFTVVGLVLPAQRELDWFRAQAAQLESPDQPILLVHPECEDGLAWPGRAQSEYGFATSCVGATARVMIQFVLAERFAEDPRAEQRWFPVKVQLLRADSLETKKQQGDLPADVVVWRGDRYRQGRADGSPGDGGG